MNKFFILIIIMLNTNSVFSAEKKGYQCLVEPENDFTITMGMNLVGLSDEVVHIEDSYHAFFKCYERENLKPIKNKKCDDVIEFTKNEKLVEETVMKSTCKCISLLKKEKNVRKDSASIKNIDDLLLNSCSDSARNPSSLNPVKLFKVKKLNAPEAYKWKFQ